MANFAQMSTKKLNTLLNAETTSTKDKEAIQKVLNTRNAIKNDDAIAEQSVAGEAAGSQPSDQGTSTKAKKQHMTDEERVALAAKLREEALNHKCEVVPFNSLEWVPGVIVGIIEEKKSNRVLYAVKSDDNRRIVKPYASPLIKVLDEVVETPKKVTSHKKTALDENGNPIEKTETPWTDEEIEADIQKVIGNVGRTCSFQQSGIMGRVEENAPVITGRITSLVPNKRNRTILYRILLDKAEGETKDVYAHKVFTTPSLVIADSLDEEGEKINKGFCARRYKENVNVAKTPKEAFELAEADLNKAKEALAKAEALVAKRQTVYDEAKAKYEETLANGTENAPESGETDEELM